MKCSGQWGIDMAKIILKDISYRSDEFSVQAIVRRGITVIGGDSSTFKSYYYALMQNEALISNDDRFVFMNYAYKDIKKLTSGEIHDKVVFIDNADIIIPEDKRIRDFFANSDNQYVILGRDVGRYSYSLDDWAVLIQRGSSVVELSYVIKEAGKLWQ